MIENLIVNALLNIKTKYKILLVVQKNEETN